MAVRPSIRLSPSPSLSLSLSPVLADLAQVFRAVMKQHNLAPGDFPDLEPFRSKLADTNFTKFPKLKVKMLEELDEVSMP